MSMNTVISRLAVCCFILSAASYARAGEQVLLAAATSTSSRMTSSEVHGAPPASASSLVPGQGAFGLGASLVGLSAASLVTVPILEGGVNGSYWIDDRAKLVVDFGFSTVENGLTNFIIGAGVDYYLVKSPTDPFGVFVGGLMGINHTSQSGGGSNLQFAVRAGAGAEYFFNRHFGAEIFNGLHFNSKPNTLALLTRVGLNWYF